MPKKTKPVDGKKIFTEVLARWGLSSIRSGGLEYTVATNLLIIEELQKIKKSNSLLDVS